MILGKSLFEPVSYLDRELYFYLSHRLMSELNEIFSLNHSKQSRNIISAAFFFTYFCFVSAVLSDYESAEDSEVSMIGLFSFGVGWKMYFENVYTPVIQKYCDLLVTFSCTLHLCF